MSDSFTERQLDLLKDLFHRCEVIVAYLFGSIARGEKGPLSDIDIGVLFHRSSTENERFELRLRMIGELTGILQSSRVDLVVLNDVPVALCFQVIKEGQILHCADEPERVDFEVRTMTRWLDRKYYDDRHARIVLEQIRKEGFG